MTKRHILALFTCNLVLWSIGQGIAPLLPVHAAGLGADQGKAGACLALSMVALAAGTVSAGWLAGRFGRRRLAALMGGVAAPALYGMGQAATLAGLVLSTAVAFFCAGAILAANSIAAGLWAKGTERGKVFGLLALASGLGPLLGGGLAGPIAARWGFASMYAVLAAASLLAPLALMLWREPGAAPAPGSGAAAGEATGLGRGLWLVMAAGLGSAVAGYFFFAGRSFVMAGLGFGPGALTTAAAVGALLALPVPLLAGWLSDRLGRRRFMAVSFLATTAALLVLSRATALWHFWAASLLHFLAAAGGPATSALVTDLVPRQALGRALALSNATAWVGGILGCTLTGFGMKSLGTAPTLLAGACLPLVAVALLAASRGRRVPARETRRAATPPPAELQPATA